MPVKFSVQIENQFGYDWEQTKDIILKTEELGYHSFYICDHFFLDSKSEERNALEAWTVLTAAAMITDRITFGTLVTGNNYRNPALLAKIAASLDMMSGGRMEFGIGAGWKEIEYNAYGYDFPSVKDRLDMLEETLHIVKALWTQPKATYKGKHFRIKDAFCAPRPPKMPLILIGGGGEKRTLKLVAEHADYCNLYALPLDDLKKKLDALKGHCQGINRDYDSVGKSLFTSVYVCESQEEADSYIAERAKQFGHDEQELRERMYPKDMSGGWVGTPEQIRDRIEFMQGLDFDYFHFQQPLDLSTTMVERFANLVKDKYFS
ncbi:MAG: TIGR03560 family F420-dependent LLM class oxidoreductase [Candidatus Kariarchaeaceae archaeon]|jgi:F420-dependent oxidoreductase-like protein